MTAPTLSPVRSSPAPPVRVSADEVLAGIVIGAVLVALWPLLLMVRGGQPVPLALLVAHVCGMLAGYAVVVLVGLMSRAPWLERSVGADRLARWHGAGGRAVVLLVVAHAVAAVEVWAQSRQESVAISLWHVLRLPWLIAATLGTGLLLTVAAVSVREARRRLSYERWHAIHLLVYIAIALSFLHQLAGPDLAGRRVLQVLWAFLYTGVFALVVQHRLLTPLRMASRHRMRVQAVVPEGPGVVSIVIQGRHLEELRAEAGQFFRWRFLAPDFWATAHPFSLSAPPTGDHLRLTVKALGNGSGAMQRLEPGTWVLAEGPYGAMTAARRTRPNVLLIAGGVGITPMRALFQTLPLGAGQDLLLLYRARSPQDVLFRDELDAIARRRGARVCYLTGPGDRLSPDLLRRVAPDVSRRDVYFCGPPAMSDDLRRALREVGLPDRQFHEERFSF